MEKNTHRLEQDSCRRKKPTRFKTVLQAVFRSLLFPPKPVVLACPVVVVACMVWVFGPGRRTASAWSALIACVSIYAIVVLCMNATRIFSGGGAGSSLERIPLFGHLLGRIMEDGDLRSLLVALASLAIDVAWAAVNVALGVINRSAWAITLGAYYVCLAAMQAALFLHMRRRETRRRSHEIALCRRCGVGILALALPMAGIVVLNLHNMGTFSHPDWMTVCVAAYGFVKLAVAIVGFMRNRRGEEPVLLASSSVSLVGALANFLTMGILMLDTFSGEAASEGKRLLLTAGTGAGSIVAIVIIGIALVVHARHLRVNEAE